MPIARVILWVASLGGLALLFRSLWFTPVPLGVAVTAMAGYVVLCVLGLVMPRWQMYGDAVTHGEPGRRVVSLTFDDGPYPPTTRKVLEALSSTEHKATFFVVGQKARAFPDLIREIHEAGHEIALHGYTHDRLFSWRKPSYVAADLKRSGDVIEEILGIRPRWFRPPLGFVSPRTAAGAKKAGVQLAAWSVRGFDGLARSTEEAVLARLDAGLIDGAVVLLHDAAEGDDFEPVGVTAIERILAAVSARGLCSVTLSELMAESEREREGEGGGDLV